MKKFSLHAMFPLITLAVLVFALSRKIFTIPPLGKMLNPFVGAVQNDNENVLKAVSVQIDQTQLFDTVKVFFDSRKVPHIYARNTEDLYFVQGYVTASLRLWQMDFMTYATAGRLSEIFNPEDWLAFDRHQRRLGVLDAARKSLELIESDPESDKILSAYTRGVNSFIEKLSYKDIPLEYKLLDYEVEHWTKLKTVLILKSMAKTLSGFEQDMSMSQLMLAVGEGNFNKIFPDYHSYISPIVKSKKKRSQQSAFPFIKRPEYLDYSFLTSRKVVSAHEFNPKLGSNSWAVSGKKTSSGFPILCNDPHLTFSLPSIWLEMQLSAPNVNVYGVTIPGAPAVIIGFNNDIAWGITNGADDVKDWYKLKVTDDYKKYEIDGQWCNLDFVVESIGRRGQAAFLDTIYKTVYGPIVVTSNFNDEEPELTNFALRWELHNPSNEFLTFIKLNRAKNYDDYRDAIKHFQCPSQNFTFADKAGNIAIAHQGSIPVKAPGEGRFIMDGTTSASMFNKHIPFDSLPHVLNPEVGFVFSANQHPTDEAYNYYYNGYFSETRANRIRELLEGDDKFDVNKMMAMQLDNRNILFSTALPTIRSLLDKKPITHVQQSYLQQLNAWSGDFDRNNETAKFFDIFWEKLRVTTWDEFRQYDFTLPDPTDYVLLDMIKNEPTNDFFDKINTNKKETAADIVHEVFNGTIKAYESATAEEGTRWSDFNKVYLMHMTGIPAFGKMDIPSSGHFDAINAVSRRWGPSWRMVVELGERPKAFGVYPGGQSGGLGSKYFDNFVGQWQTGGYFPLQFFVSPEEASKQATTTWILK
jgi:penicillin amidase